jgi:cytochrome c peroxidase
MTGPWGHDGVFNTLEEIVRHHLNAEKSIKAFDWKKVSLDGGPLQLNFADNHTQHALARLKEQRKQGRPGVLQDVDLNDAQVNDLVEFLKAQTDPCLKNKECLAKWIPGPSDPDPDGLRLCAKDGTGKELWAPSCTPARAGTEPPGPRPGATQPRR